MAAADATAAVAATTEVNVDASPDGPRLWDLGLMLLEYFLVQWPAAVGTSVGQRRVHDLSTCTGMARRCGVPYSAPGLRPGRFGRRDGAPLEKGAACRLAARLTDSSSVSRRRIR